MDRVSVRLMQLVWSVQGQGKFRIRIRVGGPVYHPPHRLTPRRKAPTYRASSIQEPGPSMVPDGRPIHTLSTMSIGMQII